MTNTNSKSDRPAAQEVRKRPQRTYLTDGNVIPISPDVALLYGINEAAFLQQLHFLLSSAEVSDKKYNFVGGFWWVYYSYERWLSHLPWLSVSTVRRITEALIEKDVVVIRANPHNSWDKTRWYRLAYDTFYAQLEAAAKIEEDAPAEADPPSVQNEQIDDTNLDSSISPEGADDSNNDLLDESSKDLKDTSTKKRRARKPAAAPADDEAPAEKTPKNERIKPFPVYDAVEALIFKQTYDETIPRNWRAPVGGISRWLMCEIGKYGIYNVGYQKTPAAPEDVKKFADWYQMAKPGLNLPESFNKFVRYWREWQSTRTIADLQQTAPAATPPDSERTSIKEAMLRKMQEKKGQGR